MNVEIQPIPTCERDAFVRTVAALQERMFASLVSDSANVQAENRVKEGRDERAKGLDVSSLERVFPVWRCGEDIRQALGERAGF